MTNTTSVAKKEFPLGFGEFVTMIAALMSLTALAIDAMLPALGMIAQDYSLTNANDRQWVVLAFVGGFGIGSLFYGPLCDRFGRKVVLLPALAFYAFFAVLAAFAPDFSILVALRFCAGLAAGALRIVVTSVVRDRFVGDRMARVMSLAFIVFTLVPMLAPTLGAGILLVASWPWIFFALALLGVMLLAWTWIRLPETLAPENVIPIRRDTIWTTWKTIIFHRKASGYMLAGGLSMGPLFGFVASAQQIFDTAYGVGDYFPLIFAIITANLALSAFLNARFVMRFGARRIAHSAILTVIVLSAMGLAIGASTGGMSLVPFVIITALSLGMTGFINSNCSSIAMEPFGGMAGAASSFQAFSTTIVSALLGALIGQLFDGTNVPLTTGFLLCSMASLTVLFWAEKGRLFQRKIPEAV
ncbi:multidrug effflux MFS transporter [Sphingorhabdus sp. Alg239-R122]|uniref:multidrug effflux MFS transporter n=1 Tax=Sphingorhabdus sp. Alg239-R122 TaxID=2305989 RepID=UPI0013D95F41|nr:multidrug effflux MFS transporter [Sphingorhabdus sp. Alg239-R122]